LLTGIKFKKRLPKKFRRKFIKTRSAKFKAVAASNLKIKIQLNSNFKNYF